MKRRPRQSDGKGDAWFFVFFFLISATPQQLYKVSFATHRLCKIRMLHHNQSKRGERRGWRDTGGYTFLCV